MGKIRVRVDQATSLVNRPVGSVIWLDEDAPGVRGLLRFGRVTRVADEGPVAPEPSAVITEPAVVEPAGDAEELDNGDTGQPGNGEHPSAGDERPVVRGKRSRGAAGAGADEHA